MMQCFLLFSRLECVILVRLCCFSAYFYPLFLKYDVMLEINTDFISTSLVINTGKEEEENIIIIKGIKCNNTNININS